MNARLKWLVFYVGFAGLLAQLLVLRELVTVFYGNELVLGLALGCWLWWTGLGSIVLSRWIVPADDAGAARRRAGLVLAGAGALMPVSLALVRLSRPILGIDVTAMAGLFPAFITAFVALSGVCLGVGLLFPLCCRAAGSTGRVYVWEAAGAAVAGLGYSLVLSRVGHPMAVCGCVAVGAGVAALPAMDRSGRRTTAAVLACLAVSCIILFVPKTWMTRLAWRPLEVVETVDSRYGRVTMTRHAAAGEETLHSLFVNGLLAWTWPDPPSAETMAHYALLQAEHPARVLLIGGGVSGVAAEVLKHPVVRLVYVELDPTVISLTRRHLPAAAEVLGDPRVEVVYGDGRRYLKVAPERFDVILVALPRPHTAQINRFYTAEFFQEAAGRLDERGVLAFSLGAAPEHYSQQMRKLLSCLDGSLRTAFGDVIVVPGTGAIFLASKQGDTLTTDARVLADRMVARQVQTVYVAPYQILDHMADYRLADVRAAIENAGETRLNTDLAPVCYYYDSVLWAAEQGRRGAARPWLERVEQALAPGLVGLLLVLFMLAMIVRGLVGSDAGAQSQVASVAVCVTGFIEILMEICCLLLLQSLYGFIYEMIGAVLFAFMLGLAAGGLWSTARVAAGRWAWRHFVLLQFAVFTYPLLLKGLAQAMTAGSMAALPGVVVGGAFCGMTFAAGLIGGLQFPLAAHFARKASERPERAAGRLYGLDLFGSCVGAMVGSALLLPLIGISGCLGIAAMLGFCLLAGVVLCDRRTAAKETL